MGGLNTFEKNLTAMLAVCGLVIVFMVLTLDQQNDELELCHGLTPAVAELVERRARIIGLLDALQVDLRTILESPAEAQLLELAELVADIRAGI